MKFDDWTSAEPARIVDLRPDGALLSLLRFYESTNTSVVHEVLGQAYSLQAQTCVIELRYIDPDYRSEHSRFYSTTFRRYPSVAHRLHFFRDEPPADWQKQANFLDFRSLEESYLGFVVMRPLPGAVIGRVALKPPEALFSDITCLSDEHVNVFGVPMKVEAAPFMAQDAQLGVCAHIAIWIVAQHHHLAFGRRRFTIGEITELIPTELGLGRPAPSSGLTVGQVTAGCRALGLPALVYKCENENDLPQGESIQRIVCRYLNSGMPVIVAAGGKHVFTLVGYQRVDAGTEDERLLFIRQDDESGPYQLVEDFRHDCYGAWEWLIVPLPAKVFVPGEVAEDKGRERLIATAEQSSHAMATELTLGACDEPRNISFRSTVVNSNQFKTTLHKRGFDDETATLYRRMQMPRWIWVVEAINRKLRSARQPSVLGEAIVDATDHGRDMHILAWRVPGALWSWRPDEDLVGSRTLNDTPAFVESIAGYIGNFDHRVQPA